MKYIICIYHWFKHWWRRQNGDSMEAIEWFVWIAVEIWELKIGNEKVAKSMGFVGFCRVLYLMIARLVFSSYCGCIEFLIWSNNFYLFFIDNKFPNLWHLFLNLVTILPTALINLHRFLIFITLYFFSSNLWIEFWFVRWMNCIGIK